MAEHVIERATTNRDRDAFVLATTNYGFLYSHTLEQALTAIATAGYSHVEILATPPHVHLSRSSPSEGKRLRRLLTSLGMDCIALLLSEVNLTTAHPEVRRFAIRQYEMCIRLASTAEVPLVEISPGRLSPLVPLPRENALAMLEDAINELLPQATQHGVDLVVETTPFGLMQTGLELAQFLRDFDDLHLGAVFDCANVFPFEDIGAGVHAIKDWIRVAHLSDTWKHKWAHTSVGRGQVDFQAFAQALHECGFEGMSVYELADGEDPAPRLAADREQLQKWGWKPTPPARPRGQP